MGTASWTDVANSALLKLGTQLIASLNQPSVGSKLCKMRLPITVPLILRKFPWKSAMTTVTLSPLSIAPPDPNWKYAYQLPTDIVRIWKLNEVSFGKNFIKRKNQIWSNSGTTTQTLSDGTIVVTGDSPVLTYVQNAYLTTPSDLDDLLIEAIACQLAVDLSYQIAESIPLKQDLKTDAKTALQNAKTVDSMETPEVFDWEASEFLTSRFAGTGYLGPVNNGVFPNSQ